jgi:hypothetical protein
MKQELKDIAIQVAASSPTSGYALFSKLTVAEWVAVTLGVLQAVYLLRKWWREETEFGMKLKGWVRRISPTRPAELDE